MRGLVLSIFPGIGMLDRAFEEEGWCIVRGPDKLWGGDIRRFHPPSNSFDGVIGGDPCQAHSRLARLLRATGRSPRYPDMTPEFERIIDKAQPRWFLRENVPQAPALALDDYGLSVLRLNGRWLGMRASRDRRFWFGLRDRRFWFGLRGQAPVELAPHLEGLVALEDVEALPAVIGGNDMGWLYRVYGKPAHASLTKEGLRQFGPVPPYAVLSEGATPSMRDRGIRTMRLPISVMAELMGFPADFLQDAPFTADEKRRVIANGVPLPMGRAIARAVGRALEPSA